VTIKQFADELGLTKGAVYKAIRSSSFTVDQITGRSGQITEEGRKILQILFPDQEPLSEPLKETQPDDSVLDDLRERLREAERARDRAEADLQNEKERRIRAEEQAEKWERLYLELQDKAAHERERILENAREAHVIAAQAQEAANKKSGFLRLFSGRKKEKPAESVDGKGQVD
jgi:membrane protein involved in colicin uptake